VTGWSALVPFNFGRPRKTRLAGRLSEEQRNLLALDMVRHVVAVLAAVPQVESIRLIAPVDPRLAGTQWVEDRGRGLNAELAAARERLRDGPALIIHADLPLLTPADVAFLVDMAGASGAAIAPDMAATGTNALALADGRPLALAFGADSFTRHRAALPDAAIVERTGLSLDVDDAPSLEAALGLGLSLPEGLS